ncbi:hypothetical protein SAMN02745671_01185 [Anaerovibrio lipolyticus DSM 3074]|uniref:Uncharacterized protein n=1 Tax=Anaerovibrio lipolyticus DSM 3074 TaxID=1120997 RepID=A0A1M6CME6_9FIRM|nr:hypothetical protein [Anaerovibrio lipolyticus]SHI62205.1 hypothetical protein SAMN02745671_01185 [Anaerovibrio lipolyticus DSM 3074]
MARKGQYHEWIEGKGLENICKWAKLGLTDIQICHNMGIAVQTYYEWQRRFPSFAEAIKEAKAIPDLEVENSLFNQATGNVYVEETKSILDPNTGKVIRIERTKKQQAPSATATIFWLKNRMPDKYRERNRLDDEKDSESNVHIYLPDNGRNEE